MVMFKSWHISGFLIINTCIPLNHTTFFYKKRNPEMALTHNKWVVLWGKNKHQICWKVANCWIDTWLIMSEYNNKYFKAEFRLRYRNENNTASQSVCCQKCIWLDGYTETVKFWKIIRKELLSIETCSNLPLEPTSTTGDNVGISNT